MAQNIKTFNLHLNNNLHGHEIQLFRGTVAAAVETDDILVT
jgi:hypothetical protein